MYSNKSYFIYIYEIDMYSNKSYFIFVAGHYVIGAHFGTSKKGNLFSVIFLFFVGKQSI